MNEKRRRTPFAVNVFDSECSTIEDNEEFKTTKSPDEEVWRSYFEFICCCVGKHSIVMLFSHFEQLNFIQDFIVYLILGIPLCYMQLLLGQYTNLGIFVLRRMIPIARGLCYVYIITIFVITTLTTTQIQENLVYFILSISPQKLAWNLCPKDLEHICWEYATDKCTKKYPCIEENTFLPTYVFWNHTFMGGAYPIHKTTFGLPNQYSSLVTVICWAAINIVSMYSFATIRKIILILVTTSTIIKLAFVMLFGSKLGFGQMVVEIVMIEAGTWLSVESWISSILRIVSSMMLGDFNYIVFGVYTTYDTKTGKLSCIGAMSVFCMLTLETIINKGALSILIKESKLDPKHYRYLVVPHSPVFLIIIPAAIGVLRISSVWFILHFVSNITSLFSWNIINITFLQQSLYQRYAYMKSYHRYVNPTFCMLGFVAGLLIQSKEAYEYRFDLLQMVDTCCQCLNLILLSFLVFYVYGYRVLCDDVQYMTGKSPTNVWRITWVMSPILLAISLPYEYFSLNHPFSPHRFIGIILLYSPFIVLAIIHTFKQIYHRDLFSILKPHPLHGPKDDNLKNLRAFFQPRKDTKYRQYQSKCTHQCFKRDETFKAICEAEREYDAKVLQLVITILD